MTSNGAKSILIRQCIFYCLTLLSIGTFAQNQPTEPITPLQLGYNQFTRVNFNSSDGITSFKDNTLMRHGTMKNFAKFNFPVEVDHFAATLIPIENYLTAEVQMSLDLDGEIFSINIINGNQITLADFTVIHDGPMSDSDVIRIGFDDGLVLYMLNDIVLHTETFNVEPELATVSLDPVSANQASFYFFFDVGFRNLAMQLNFVEERSTINEGSLATLCFDLTQMNMTTEPVKAKVVIEQVKEPHFSAFTEALVEIPINEQRGCIDIPTSLPNGLKDENRQYSFSLVDVEGMNSVIGDKRTHTVEIIDDFVAPNTTLYPGDLMFVAYESDIGSGNKHIAFTNLVPIHPGTSFQLSNANYTSLTKSFDLNNAGFTSVQFIYDGEVPLPVNTIFCVYTGYDFNYSDTNIDRIEIDGTDETSLFEITNKGSYNGNNAGFTHFDSKSWFLLQGQWTFNQHNGFLLGSVLSGIHVGGLWSIDELPSTNYSNEHPDLECLGIQGPATPGSFWAYFQCATPYNSITVFDLKKSISEFSNWQYGTGNDEVNWPMDVDICTSTCSPVDEYEPLAIEVSDLNLICGVVSDIDMAIQDWISSILNTGVSGGCYNVEVTHDYNGVAPPPCQTITVMFEAEDACGANVSAPASLTIIDETAPTFLNVDAFLDIDCFDEFMLSDVQADDECSEVTVELLNEETISETFGVSKLIRKTFIATDVCGNTSTAVQEQLLDQTNDGFTVSIGDDITICQGNTLNLTSSIVGGDGPISGSWKQAGEPFDHDINLYVAQGNISSDINLSLTDSRGCQAKDIITLTVPQLDVSINADEEYIICENAPEDITLTANLSGFGNDISYTWWNNNAGTAIGSESSYTRTYGSAIIDVSLFATDNNSGCTQLSINRVGFLDISETVTISGPSSVCQSGEIILASDFTDANNVNPDYSWFADFGAGYVNLINDNSFDYDESFIQGFISQTTTFKLEIYYEGGCTFSEEFQVSIDDINLTLSSSASSVCSPSESVSITALPQGDISGGSFDWSYTNAAGTFTLSQPTQTINVSINQPTTYNCTFTNANGCTSTSSVTIDVDNSPPSINCFNDTTIQLNGECAYYVSDYQNLAQVADNCNVSNINVFQPFIGHVLDPEVFTVSIEASDGFGNTDFCSFVVTLQPAFAEFPADVTINCEQGCCSGITGIPTSDIAGAIITYTDNVNACPAQPSANNNVSLRGDDVSSCNYCGTFVRTWEVTLPNGCTFYQEQYITVVDNESPEVQVFDVTICDYEYSQNADYTSALQITDNCTPETEVNVVLDGPDFNNNSNLYTRYYMVTDNCGNWSTWQQYITTVACESMEEIIVDQRLASHQFRIYPNPSSDYYTVEFNSDTEGDAQIFLYKISGELQSILPYKIEKGINRKRFSTQNLIEGIYLINMKTAVGDFRQKLIVIK